MKILTLNIANYDDHPGWEKRKYEIIKLLATEQADLIFLQEVRFHPAQPTCSQTYLNSGEELLIELQKEIFYQKHQIVTHPSMQYNTLQNGIFWEGKSVITNLKILEAGSLFLPVVENNKDGNKRTLMWLRLQHNKTEFCCCNLHWSTDINSHALHASASVDLAGRFLDMPFVAGGDFNGVPDAEVMKIMSDSGLQDIWQNIFTDKDGFTYPAKNPKKRIDQFWGNRQFIKEVKSIRTTGSENCSDHLALVIEFNI